MLQEIIKRYKKQTIKIAISRTLTSVMVVTFITFMLIMIEYAIPSKNIKLIIQIGIMYFAVNILRSIITLYESICHNVFEKEFEADYREKIFVKLQKTKQNEIDKIRVGEILENIINDTKEFAKYYTHGITRAYLGEF